MFSPNIYVEITRLTQEALEELHNRKTIDQVSVVLGYMQMSSRRINRYDAELRTAIAGLLELARMENRQELIAALEGLLRQMDQELAA